MAEVHASIMANIIAFHRHKANQCGSSDACFSPGSRLSCRCWPGPETLCWCSTALSAQRALRQHQQRFFPQQRGHRRGHEVMQHLRGCWPAWQRQQSVTLHAGSAVITAKENCNHLGCSLPWTVTDWTKRMAMTSGMATEPKQIPRPVVEQIQSALVTCKRFQQPHLCSRNCTSATSFRTASASLTSSWPMLNTAAASACGTAFPAPAPLTPAP